MNANEREELDIFQDIFKSFPDLLKGFVEKRFTDLKRKRNVELVADQEKVMAGIVESLSAEICKQIEKDVIDILMGQIDETMAIPPPLLLYSQSQQ